MLGSVRPEVALVEIPGYGLAGKRDLGITGHRVDLYPRLSWPIYRPAGYLLPSVGVRYTGYDLDRELVTLYRVIKHHPEEFHKQFKYVLFARDEFNRYLKVDPETLTDVQRAVR